MRQHSLICDTDIGTNPDDYFAVLLLLARSPSELRLVVTGNRFPFERARFAKRILEVCGRGDIPVVAGEEAGCIEFFAQKYIEGYEPKIEKDYKEQIRQVFDESASVTYLCVQGCSNLAGFLQSYPEYKDRIEVVHMGMSLKGADANYISGGTNMEADPAAARFVYESGIRLKVVGSHTTVNDALRIHPETALYKKLAANSAPAERMFLEHLSDYNVRRGIWPALHDPLAASVALGQKFVSFHDVSIQFNNEGKYRLTEKGVCVLVSETESKASEFMTFAEESF